MDGVLEGRGVVLAEEDWVCECGELEVVEACGCVDVCGAGGIAGHAEVVVELGSVCYF